MDERRGDILPREVESQVAVYGVWVVDGDRVDGFTSTDTAREGIRRESALGDHIPCQRATDLQYRYSKCRGGEGTIQSRGVEYRRQHIRIFGYTSYTGTLWSYWRIATSSTHDPPSATFWCPVRL